LAGPSSSTSTSVDMRELPALLAVLRLGRETIQTVVIDGYVWLDTAGIPGLGGHLHKALGGRTVVVGVAKSRFKDARFACPVLRGRSQRPLYVTSVGVDRETAVAWVQKMHGPFRIPTMLREADRLCRGHALTSGHQGQCAGGIAMPGSSTEAGSAGQVKAGSCSSRAAEVIVPLHSLPGG